MKGIVERVEQLHSIINNLRQDKWCAIIAPRFSGKTVLARQLRNALRNEHPSWKVAHIEFNKAATLDQAWDQVEKKMLASSPARRSCQYGIHIADALAQALGDSNNTYCLVLDRLDALPDQVLRLLAAELRRFRNDRHYEKIRHRLHCVLLGATELRFVAAGDYSPLFGIVEVMDLPDLDLDQTVTSFALRSDGVVLSEDARRVLFAETAGQPYLVHVLADRLAGSPTRTAEEIGSAAITWSDDCARSNSPDVCFSQAVEYIEGHHRAFEIVTKMLEEKALPTPVYRSDDVALMCGALIEREATFSFRGSMFERALNIYMDDLRKADYCCLHGDWNRALEYYGRVEPKKIQERRKEGFGKSKRRIMDLYLGLSNHSLQLKKLAEAEEFVTATGWWLFGADQACLCSQETSSMQPKIVCCKDRNNEVEFRQGAVEAAATAIGRHSSFTLIGNIGIFQGIGNDEQMARWALGLRYDQGLPGGWVEDSLRYAEPSLYMTLDQAGRRESEAVRQRKQRKLIHEMHRELLRTKDVDQVFSMIVGGVKDRLGYECAQLSLVYPLEGRIRGVKSNGVYDRVRTGTVRDLDGDDVLSLVIRDGKPRIISDCGSEDSHCDSEAIQVSGLRSQVIVPLLIDCQPVGTLQVGDTARLNAFTSSDSELLQLLADVAAIAIRMAEEREAWELAFAATGDAVIVVDATNQATLCNEVYSNIFNIKPGDKAPLTPVSLEHGAEPLIKLAFHRQKPLQTFRDVQGHRCIVTAASFKDSFDRYAGGIEIVGTRSPLYGLTEAIGEMLIMSDKEDLGRAIVNCLCTHLGYSRALFYRAHQKGKVLVSRWSSGMGSEAATRFASREFSWERSEFDQPGDGFECLRLDVPLLVVREQFSEKGIPIRAVTKDSQHRRVLILPDEEVNYLLELEREDVQEWLEVPLGPASNPIGKICLDHKGKESRFGLEDLELAALFSRWAANTMAQVIELDKARAEANVARDVHFLGDLKGLQASVWEFLLRITLEGGASFNRAAIFLRTPHSELVRGFLCHGAPNKPEWEKAIKSIKVIGNRSGFIESDCGKRLAGEISSEERQRIEVFQELFIKKNDSDNPFSCALSKPSAIRLDTTAVKNLSFFYERLEWAPPKEALICPLVFLGECEGLLYADRPFELRGITETDSEMLESLSVHLSASLRAYRLAEQLRQQVLSLSHTGVSPMTAIRGLAEALKESPLNEHHQKCLDFIIAESQRGADLVRRVLRVTEMSSRGLSPHFQKTDLCEIIRLRTGPYTVLLQADGITPQFSLAAEPVHAMVDPELIGTAFAELSANACLATRVSAEGEGTHCFRVSCHALHQGTECEVVFENSGALVPPNLRARLFDPFVSGSGGTGVGLWLVKEIVTAHCGRISYEETTEGLSRFVITLPVEQIKENR